MTYQTETRKAYELYPYHEAFEREKLAELTESMTINGWVRSPLVVFDDKLMTGSHRFRAAELTDTDIPCVKFLDVFYNLDEDEIVEIVENDDNWVVELTRLAQESDPDTAIALGLDAN